MQGRPGACLFSCRHFGRVPGKKRPGSGQKAGRERPRRLHSPDGIGRGAHPPGRKKARTRPKSSSPAPIAPLKIERKCWRRAKICKNLYNNEGIPSESRGNPPTNTKRMKGRPGACLFACRPARVAHQNPVYEQDKRREYGRGPKRPTGPKGMVCPGIISQAETGRECVGKNLSEWKNAVRYTMAA